MAADDEAHMLSKDMLSWEPVALVLHPSCISTHGFHKIATLELSNLDMLHDYYFSVLLVYDALLQLQTAQYNNPSFFRSEHGEAHPPAPCRGAGATGGVVVDEPVSRRLCRALHELLLHYPSAAGLLVDNDTDGRLEVRYPLPMLSSKLSPVEVHDTASAAEQYGPSRYGVQFHVAHASTITLSDLGDVSKPQPCMDILYPGMPRELRDNTSDVHHAPRFVMALQVTTFSCGGFTLGLTCNHAYGDGYVAATFLQNLCSISRGAGLANPPDFSQSRRVVLRAKETPQSSSTMHYTFIGTRKRTTDHEAAPVTLSSKQLQLYGTATRFVFSMDALEALRADGSDRLAETSCSRNQALMALLWKAHARVRRQVHGRPKSDESEMRFPINIRNRSIVPNLGAGYMGNAVFLWSVCATLEELCERSVAYVVDKIQKSTAVGSLGLAEALQGVVDDIELKLREGLVPFIEAGRFSMPSFVGLPFYNTDCGRGCPIYVARPSQQLRNRCIILEHPAAQAWNVLAVFSSLEEQACFQDGISAYIS